MTIEKQVEEILEKEFPQSQIELTGDGCHFTLRLISEKFVGKSRIERSRMVYAKLSQLIDSNKLHALQMKLKTPSEI